ncbi:MAG: methyltransferase domain-containing protein [Okeania sp. SIO2F4]|uniref:class I SAM-dependent methyltransferase n=1 Tax=Okeania sp. SIO2F4 TaxID=2607790 RepID=UPI001429937A|nr:methyltransferase domain-containing protein [Okeania sp. SIO2F4]NES05838.1 methyltransferase domain-containing protein [Okeania sp. SIO2F4]
MAKLTIMNSNIFIKNLMNFLPTSLRDKIYRFKQKVKTIYQELKIIYGKLTRKIIGRPAFPKLENGVINLHVGCGHINHPKFINIDGLLAPHIHYIRPIDSLAPFKDSSVDLIYGSHCLEHFSHRIVSQVLNEWFRVLKKGGILRISVPDFDFLIDKYRASGNDINKIISPLMGGKNYKFNFHMTVFNQSNLELLIKKTGFKEVIKWQPGWCEMTTLNDTSKKKISLNIEAVK